MGRGMGGGRGMGRGMGMGGGRGMGRGMGMGGGQGMGRGMGMGGGMMPPVAPPPDAQPISPSDEMASLRAQAQAMEEQLKAVNARIAGLEGQAKTPSLVAAVDAKACVACGVCAEACSFGAISMNDVAEVDPRKCTGCGVCVAECPHDALSLHARK